MLLDWSHAAAGGEQARRAPEMPASRAADPAAPTGAAAGTLAPVETLLFILVPLSTEEETPAAVGHLSPGWRAGRRDRECLAEWHVQPRTPGSHLLLPGPRLVFNRVNGRRPPATSPSLKGTQETYTLAHEENVRFVSEAWQQVEQQLGGGPAGESGPRPVQYVERTPNPRLQNFVPIDLDEWWAQQFLARITNCS
ncbi:MAPK regulated corepressor interacting protein 2 isoform X1 [Tursiops truncatus]|uniref:MAPK regulated corepressor interacting protein 2 isoform X1 n=1 Tax=Tursiops truncatus TaxID=9739 RepID=UPI000952B3BD